MDEKGVMKGIGDNTKVIISKAEAKASLIQPGNREWVSIIECIGANGYVLPPFVIFEGQRIQQAWIDASIDPQTVIQVSPNGWTDNTIALRWLEHFDHHTATRAVGRKRLLILDGHASHVNYPFVEYCSQHGIIPLCLPPHSTHLLQPLDVGIFSPLAKAYKRGVQRSAIYGAVRINNLDFLREYQQARGTIPRNIPSAFRGCGLIPLDPTRVLEKVRPKTPPYASITDEHGRTVNLPVSPDLATKINTMVAELIEVCPTPAKATVGRMKDLALTALADSSVLQKLNKDLVNHHRQVRQKRTRKYYGEARVLTVEEMQVQAAARKEVERTEMEAKARRMALRGVIGFAKAVYKELHMGPDVFD
jgi:hypothetical protein